MRSFPLWLAVWAVIQVAFFTSFAVLLWLVARMRLKLKRMEARFNLQHADVSFIAAMALVAAQHWGDEPSAVRQHLVEIIHARYKPAGESV